MRLCIVTVSMRVLSGAEGYRYLLSTVVVGDGQRDFTEPLTRYYSQAGTPPGFWLGTGLAGLGDGTIRTDQEVTETQLRLLLGNSRDPMTGQPLGKARAQFKSAKERIERRVRALPSNLAVAERAEAITQIEQEELAKKQAQPVAGFDHTFSVPKSVSTLWAVADGGTQALIARAHHAAIKDVLDLLERDVAMTRVGADAGSGSVAQIEVRGIVATAYDHYDSRSADPQLHTHVVIANRVQGVHDGKWRTLDGRPIHRAVVALSEHYNAVLADHLSRDLGISWEWRDRGRNRNRAFEIQGVPDELLQEFSSRSHDIERQTDALIADYTERHGRAPSKRTIIRLRAEATLRTRPDKTLHSLAELTEQWRDRATRVLGEDSTTWAGTILTTSVGSPLLRADDIPLEAIQEIGQAVVHEVGQRRSTWQRWNLYAEAARQLTDLRFASTIDREAVTGLIVDAAEQASIRLTPPELAYSPRLFQREDGSSVFRPKHGALFSSEALLAAEDRLLDLSTDLTAPTVAPYRVDRAVARRTDSGHRLSADQAAAITRIALSGRVLDVLIGPAGTGKTTTLAALRRAWESGHGPGSVVGLATSAVAAEVLGEELRIGTDNTAKWAWEHRDGNWDFRAGQLVIVDEASMGGTFLLDQLTQHAREVGAKVLLVGDAHQLDAVDTSGAFGLVSRSLGDDVAELVEVRRFTNAWERTASLALRLGETDVLAVYEAERRIQGGDYESMLDQVYTAWLTDTQAGRSSLMIAQTVEAVIGLNLRARLDRIRAGSVNPAQSLRLHDGTEAAAGDRIITRRNDRRLRTSRVKWVKNGDLWNVAEAHPDGSLTVTRAKRWGGAIRLPASYVAEHVELAYAVTAHRAQGTTVDTAHALVHSAEVTREALYVAMTRGKESNRMYVATDQAQLEEHQQRPDQEVTARTILEAVLAHTAAEPSAHEAIEAEQEAWSNIGQLAAEYEMIAQTAQHDRWVRLLETSGLTPEQVDQAIESEAFGTLTAELRRADANHHQPELLLPALIAERPIDGAADVAAVLRHRLQRATTSQTGASQKRAPRLVAGLIPRAVGVTDPDMRRGLTERERLITERAQHLARTALTEQHPWTAALGDAPTGRTKAVWLRQAETIAAYRDKYQITDPRPLGGEPATVTQRIDAARANAALERARTLATPTRQRRRAAAGQAPARTL